MLQKGGRGGAHSHPRTGSAFPFRTRRSRITDHAPRARRTAHANVETHMRAATKLSAEFYTRQHLDTTHEARVEGRRSAAISDAVLVLCAVRLLCFLVHCNPLLVCGAQQSRPSFMWTHFGLFTANASRRVRRNTQMRKARQGRERTRRR